MSDPYRTDDRKQHPVEQLYESMYSRFRTLAEKDGRGIFLWSGDRGKVVRILLVFLSGLFFMRRKKWTSTDKPST